MGWGKKQIDNKKIWKGGEGGRRWGRRKVGGGLFEPGFPIGWTSPIPIKLLSNQLNQNRDRSIVGSVDPIRPDF